MEKFKSIVTDNTSVCYFCGKKATVMHVCFTAEGWLTEMAKADGLTVPLCWDCNVKQHLDGKRMHTLKQVAQIAWEDKHPGESFARKYGRDYLAVHKKPE